MANPKKLYRSNDNKMILGVCGGIAEYFNLDPTLIRVIAILFIVSSAGIGLFAYILSALVMPSKPY
jgi:phage shock protein C